MCIEGIIILVSEPTFDGLISNWKKYNRDRRVQKWLVRIKLYS